MSLISVSQVCLAAGLDVLQRQGEPTTNDRERRAAGYDLFRNDASWFESRFIELRDGLKISQMLTFLFPHLTGYFGQNRLDDPGRERFIDTLTDVAFRNLPYPAGINFLGRTCPRRYLHSWPSAMETYGLGRHHLRAFVDGTPKLSTHVGDRRQDTLINVDVADRMFIGKTPFINSSEVARKLGRRPQLAIKDVKMLVQAGVFQFEKGADRTRNKTYFSEKHIDETIKGILARCRALPEEEEGMVTTHHTSASLGIPYELLWRLIVSGPLRNIGHRPGESLSKGLRVNLAETLSFVSGVTDPMLTQQVIAILGIDRNILRLLKEGGWIQAFLAKPEYRSKLQYTFRRGDIEAFHARYVNLRETSRHLNQSKNALIASGLVPAINIKSTLPAPAGAVFFLRSDVF